MVVADTCLNEVSNLIVDQKLGAALAVALDYKFLFELLQLGSIDLARSLKLLICKNYTLAFPDVSLECLSKLLTVCLRLTEDQ